MKNNKKFQNKRHREIFFVLLLIFCISVGFSYLSAQLDIIGNATMKKPTWDVHFDKIVESTAITDYGSVVADLGVATISEDSATQLSFEANLNYPGDYYEFTFEVTNGGNIDAMLQEQIENINLTPDQEKYLIYEITYEDGSLIEENDGIRAGESLSLKIRVTYEKDIDVSDLLDSDTEFNATYTLNYVQATDDVVYKDI